MVDKDNMSVEEMLAYCRQTDGGEAPSDEPAGSSAEGSSVEEASTEAASVDASAGDTGAGGASPASAKPASAKAAREMSVEEMLAAARGDGGGGSAEPAASDSAAGDSAESKPAAAKPASAKAAREMSVEEMMAAARGQGPKAEAKPAAKAKPAAAKAKPAAAKAKAKPAPSGPKETGSILAGGAKGPKPGPMSKAEAEQRKAADKAKPAAKAKPAPPVMPERPAYATPAPAPAAATDDSDRRGFFAAFGGVLLGSSMALGFASLAVTNLLWVLGLARFMFPNILIEPPTQFKVGFPEEYAPGQVQTKYKAQFGVWVVRYEYQGEQQIYALKSVCTHLGCTPNWLEGEQKFKCPCHGSGFYKDGINFEGPAPRPLERYAIALGDDGQLEVDKSQQFNEEKGQWRDPASFVKV